MRATTPTHHIARTKAHDCPAAYATTTPIRTGQPTQNSMRTHARGQPSTRATHTHVQAASGKGFLRAHSTRPTHLRSSSI